MCIRDRPYTITQKSTTVLTSNFHEGSISFSLILVKHGINVRATVFRPGKDRFFDSGQALTENPLRTGASVRFYSSDGDP